MDRVGTEPVDAVLREVTVAAADFYEQGFPMAASLFSEPALLDAHRGALRARGAGPHLVGRALGAYLAAERELGRVHPDVDPNAAAGLLLGACLERAFLGHFVEERPSVEEFAATLVRTLFTGLAAWR